MRPEQPHAVGEADGERAGLERGRRRQEPPVHEVAALAVQHLAGPEVALRRGHRVGILEHAIAPLAVGDYLLRHLKGSRLEVLPVTGHCPHLTHPELTIAALQRILATV